MSPSLSCARPVVNYFPRACGDEPGKEVVKVVDVAVAAATQRMVRIGLDRVKADPPAWQNLPTHYLVATAVRCVPPELQCEMAARMEAVVTEIDSSHAPVLSRLREVAEFLDRAGRDLSR